MMISHRRHGMLRIDTLMTLIAMGMTLRHDLRQPQNLV